MLGILLELSVDNLVNGVSDTLALREGAGDLVVSDNEHVSDSGVEDVAGLVLQGDDGDVAELLDDGLDNSNSAQVVSVGDQSLVADSELEVLLNGVGLEVVEDGVANLERWVRESEGSGIVGDGVWDLVGTNLDSDDLEQLLGGLLVLELQEGESSLLIVEDSELVTSLWDGDDVCTLFALTHEADWELAESSDLSVNSDLVLLLLEDLSDLSVGQSVTELSSEDQMEWDAFS